MAAVFGGRKTKKITRENKYVWSGINQFVEDKLVEKGN
jgi:hypothetical protein